MGPYQLSAALKCGRLDLRDELVTIALCPRKANRSFNFLTSLSPTSRYIFSLRAVYMHGALGSSVQYEPEYGFPCPMRTSSRKK